METVVNTVKIYSSAGECLETRSLEGTPLAGEVDKGLLHQIVRWQRAGRRAGTHSVKTRAEVAGGGIKPWKQKGTGRARSGSNTSPVWVGGGIAHGPRPRDYSFDVNRKQRQLAVTHALRSRVQVGAVSGLQGFDLSAIKTAAAAKVLTSIGLTAPSKVLVVFSGRDDIAEKSLRNIPGIQVCSEDNLNVYDVMHTSAVLFVGDALDKRIARGS
ncbi:MAG: 50S ribosomal protein L4 [bacterium]|nr:50S ribosomal protein L4 [bacterium]